MAAPRYAMSLHQKFLKKFWPCNHTSSTGFCYGYATGQLGASNIQVSSHLLAALPEFTAARNSFISREVGRSSPNEHDPFPTKLTSQALETLPDLWLRLYSTIRFFSPTGKLSISFAYHQILGIPRRAVSTEERVLVLGSHVVKKAYFPKRAIAKQAKVDIDMGRRA